MYRTPPMSSSATNIKVRAPTALPPSQNTSEAITLTLTQILAFPALWTKRSKQPGCLDIYAVPFIRDMPAAHHLGHSTDAEMIIHLVQSAAIQDPGYTWADAPGLYTWLLDELTERLNYILNAEASGLFDYILAEPLIRDMEGVPEHMATLVKWCKDRNAVSNFAGTEA